MGLRLLCTLSLPLYNARPLPKSRKVEKEFSKKSKIIPFSLHKSVKKFFGAQINHRKNHVVFDDFLHHINNKSYYKNKIPAQE